jgi:predicted outer membrane repeat protein
VDTVSNRQLRENATGDHMARALLLSILLLFSTACSDDEPAANADDSFSEEFEDDNISFNDAGVITRWYVVGRCPSACGSNVSCRQLTGSYYRWAACDCAPGFANLNIGYWSRKGNAIGGACVRCTACDENATSTGGCYVEQDTECACNEGYEGDGYTCTATDPCAIDNGGCHVNADCTATDEGNANCSCADGFEGNGLDCAWVDPCLTANGGCDANAACTSTDGEPGATCACADGFEGDGAVCTDIDECAVDGGGCSENATCTNTPGASMCMCNIGFAGDGVTCEAANAIITLADDCNLNQAIESANTNAGVGGCVAGNGTGDMIVVQGSPNLLLEAGSVTITEDLVIEGVSSRENVNFSPGPLAAEPNRLFVGEGVTVTMRRISIRGLLENKGTLILDDFEMSMNRRASDEFTKGGAIVNSGTIQGTNVLFGQNSASAGGAIHSTGTVTLTGAVFRRNDGLLFRGNNNRPDSLRGSGGAIDGGTVTIRDGLFDSNSVDGDPYSFCSYDAGVGSAIRASNVTLENVVFRENFDGSNGVVHAYTADLTNVVFEDNNTTNTYPCDRGGPPDSVGAVLVTRDAQVRRSSFVNNSGGAVQRNGGGHVTIDDSTISGNAWAFDIDAALRRSTVVDNPKLTLYGDAISAQNSIVDSDLGCRISRPFTSLGGNVLGGTSGCQFVDGADGAPDWPLVDGTYGPLQLQNERWVHPLLAGSAAIDSHECADLADGRGAARPQGALCDSGSYEYGPDCSGESCVCDSGTTGDGVVCTDLDECLDDRGGCIADASCDNVFGSRECTCAEGLWGNGVTACDTCSECREDQAEVTACAGRVNAECVDCPRGFRGDGPNCVDINECESDDHGCNANATCTNIEGGRTCACDEGYFGDGLSCTPCQVCGDNALELAQCDADTDAVCEQCPPGHRAVGLECQDIDECQDGLDCGQGATCVNNVGGYVCDCEADMSWHDGQGCQGCSVCDDPNAPEQIACAPGADTVCAACHPVCLSCDGVGPEGCTVCADGYEMRDGVCVDVNECAPSYVVNTGQRLQWQWAKNRCVSAGMKLAEPKTQDQLDALHAAANTSEPVWVGANGRSSNVGDYRWSDDSRVTFELLTWPNSDPAGKCIAKGRGAATLRTKWCTFDPYFYACETPAPCPGQACVNEPGSFRCE